MGVRTPETCWAVNKRQIINWRDCCIWLVNLFEGGYVRMLLRHVRRNLVLIVLRRVAYVAGIGGMGSACCFLEGHLENCLIIYSVISKVEVTVTAYI